MFQWMQPVEMRALGDLKASVNLVQRGSAASHDTTVLWSAAVCEQPVFLHRTHKVWVPVGALIPEAVVMFMSSHDRKVINDKPVLSTFIFLSLNMPLLPASTTWWFDRIVIDSRQSLR